MSRRDDLLQRRQELVRRLDAIRRDYERGLSADSEERAVELENAEVLTEIQRVTREELAKVDRALANLAAGRD